MQSVHAAQRYFPISNAAGQVGERGYEAQNKQLSHTRMQLCSGGGGGGGGILTPGHRRPHRLLRGLALQPQGASLKATQVVVQRLDVSEDAHGVWLAAHHHHILHLNEALTAGQIPETQKLHQNAGPSHQPQNRAWPGAGGSQVLSNCEFTSPQKSLCGYFL